MIALLPLPNFDGKVSHHPKDEDAEVKVKLGHKAGVRSDQVAQDVAETLPEAVVTERCLGVVGEENAVESYRLVGRGEKRENKEREKILLVTEVCGSSLETKATYKQESKLRQLSFTKNMI